MNLEDISEWQIKTMKCESQKCKSKTTTYELVGYTGVPWRRKYIYQCKECKTEVRL